MKEMANFKRKGPKSTRVGCLLCKPHKHQRVKNTKKGKFLQLRKQEEAEKAIPFEEYESLLETLDILETEPDILNKLKAAERQIASGRYKIWPKKSRHRRAA